MQVSPMAVITLNNFTLPEAIYELLRELCRRASGRAPSRIGH
jgi:hypothetical protein